MSPAFSRVWVFVPVVTLAIALCSWFQNSVASSERPLVVAINNRAAAGQHVHLVLVIVQVLRRVTARLDLKLAHREVRGLFARRLFGG